MKRLDFNRDIELRVLSLQGDIILDCNHSWSSPADLTLWLNDYLKDYGNVHIFLTQGCYVHDFINNY